MISFGTFTKSSYRSVRGCTGNDRQRTGLNARLKQPPENGSMSKELRTYQCRIAIGKTGDEFLSAYAALYGKAERTFFTKLQSGGDLTGLKREFLPKFGITARQFNALASEVKGKIQSIKERRVGL